MLQKGCFSSLMSPHKAEFAITLSPFSQKVLGVIVASVHTQQSGLALNTRVNTGVSNDANQLGQKVFECLFESFWAVSSCHSLAVAAKAACRELIDAAF